MALRKWICGDWLDLPSEALQSEQAFKRWFSEHHWPYCRDNAKRVPITVLVAEPKSTAKISVVRFSEQLNHPKIEIIPERAGHTWRVLNRKSQSWPIVRTGDVLNITNLDDVQVISGENFLDYYAVLAGESPAPEPLTDVPAALPQH